MNFEEYLINIGCRLDFQSGSCIMVWKYPKTQDCRSRRLLVVLYHKSFSKYISVDLICLGFTNSIFHR